MYRPKVCFILTDAVSYQMLCRGQLEYLKENSNFKMTFVCGGKQEHLDDLAKRNVGDIFDAKLVREPSLIKDLKSLITLIIYFSANRFDLIVYSTPKALLLGSLSTSLTFHKNTIAIVRGRAYERFSGKKRLVYQLLDKVALLNSKKTIFISDSLRRAYLKEKIINKSKSYLLGSGSSNGVDIDRFKPYENPTINKEFIVLIVGRICEDKGLYDLAQIISNVQTKNVIFKLVGSIEDSRSERFLNSLLSDNANVQYIPPTQNVEKYFKNADLHLFLTHREGFGNVAIEAASCGVPTFAYDVIGVKDSVKEGVSGKKFPFKDFESIANAINEAAKDKTFNQKYSHARDWAVRNFNQEYVWANYLNFYLENIE